MKKQEFIEKYGEEAWERKKENDKKYRESHREEMKKYAMDYYANNREEMKKSAMDYYANNREKSLDRMKKYNIEHKDELKLYKQKYYLDNQDRIKKNSRDNSKKSLSTMDGRANNLLCSYRKSDKGHNRGECTLTKEWIIENIFKSACVYCGETDWKKLGCDRIDDTRPHTPENCVCACKKCNTERYYKRLSVYEFRKYSG